MGSCLIIACAWGKTTVDSFRQVSMNVHIINPVETKGKNCFMGALNIFPNIKPMQAMVTPIDNVIQNGPSEDLRYLCLISENANKRGNLIC